MLFIGSCSGIFYALDKDSGKVRWQYDIKRDGNQTSFHGDMLITEDLVVIGTDGGNVPTGVGYVYAFEHKTGAVRWKYFAGRGVTSDILQYEDNFYAITLEDALLCLDAESGKLNWKFAGEYTGFNQNLSNSPAIANGSVFFGGMDGVVYALDADSGKAIWETNLDVPASTSLLAHAAELYAGTADGHIFRLSPQTGEVTGSFAIEGTAVGKPVMTDSLLIFFPSRGGRLGVATDIICLDLPSNKLRWRQSVAEESGIKQQPVVQLDTASENQACEAELVWSTPYPYRLGNSVVIGNSRGGIFAYDIRTGKQRWSHQLSGAIRSFGKAGGVLYIGTVEGMIYALSFDRVK